jgi:hypothetical protein
MTSKLDLQAIRKRAEAATEGPWIYDKNNGELLEFGVRRYASRVLAQDENADFIINARTDVIDLTIEVERLREALKDIVNVDGAYVYRSRDADEAFEIAREALK